MLQSSVSLLNLEVISVQAVVVYCGTFTICSVEDCWFFGSAL